MQNKGIMPKIYYDNAQIKNRFLVQKENIDKKINKDRLLDKYAHRFNLNLEKSKNIIQTRTPSMLRFKDTRALINIKDNLKTSD